MDCRSKLFAILFALCLLLLPVPLLVAQALTASIRGTITDPSGAVIPDVQLTAKNTSTGISYNAKSSSNGLYEFPALPLGTYSVTVVKSGFKTFEAKGIVLTVQQVYTLSPQLQIGTVSETVTVEASPAQVQTTSMERGVTISAQEIEDAPLDGRDWIQLQQSEPGVMSMSDRFGTYATNGSQSQQNTYLINGVDSNDNALNTPLEIPSPDAISSFNMITSTINPEYGRNSGAILDAPIKSGTNQFHGDAFEFYRDTSLNSRDYILGIVPKFHRNIFGGTIGGPVWKNHTFFFFSYQGERFAEPQAHANPEVPSAAELGGDFSGSAAPISASANVSPIPLFGDNASPCPASGANPCADGTPYSTLFSTNMIPSVDFNSVAASLAKKYLPANEPGVAGDIYAFDASTVGKQDQEIFRIDQKIGSKDTLWWYSLFERDPSTDTLPFAGGDLPGFGDTSPSTVKEHAFSWLHAFSPTMLNQLRLGFSRLNFSAASPQTVAQPSSFGFTGINSQLAGGASAPYMAVVGGDVNFSMGFSYFGPQPRVDNTYQADDSFTKVYGNHSIKFGYAFRRFEVFNPFSAYNNGYYLFQGGGAFSTGNPMADFLLGYPDSYTQSSGGLTVARAYEHYAYVQDQWQIKPDLTFTYGSGWDDETPFTNFISLNCFTPYQQSVIYPTAPPGLNFVGDTNCSPSGYRNHLNDFAPRFGIAWSPNWGWVSGGPGKFSIRAGFGIYYNRTEEELQLQFLTNPPFGITDGGVHDAAGGVTSFIAPFTDVRCLSQTGQALNTPSCSASPGTIPNKYPFVRPPAGSAVDFSAFEPFGLATIDPNFRTPYAENFNLTIERALPGQIILDIAYVGSMGHRLEMWYERNPGFPGACVSDPNCAGTIPFFEWLFPQYHPYDSTVFGSIGTMTSMGNSNYNSFQVTFNKRPTHGLYFLASYTYGHSLDWASSFENETFGFFQSNPGTDPFNFKRWYGNSAFDGRQRLSFLYGYSIPKIPGTAGMKVVDSLVNGWHIASVTTFQTGLPVGIANDAFGLVGVDSGTCPGTPVFTVSVSCWDVPNVSGAVRTMNPRSTTGNYWFDPSLFSTPVVPANPFVATSTWNPETGGTIGRGFIHGPGINNFDLQLSKDFPIAESYRIEFRAEAFNIFNHVNFNNPDGEFQDPTFGQILSDAGSRIIELAAKFYF